MEKFDADTVAWVALDTAIPASQWNAEQRSTIDAVIPVMEKLTDNIEKVGRSSASPTFQDFAVFAAQYRRAYVAALPTYTPADSYLSGVSTKAAAVIYQACKAAGG